MKYHLKAFAALAIVAAVAGCGGSNSPEPEPAPAPAPAVPYVLLADGTSLHSAKVSATGYTQIGTAEVPAAGLAADHQIFSIIVHPNKRWIYVASAAQSWGNARINRFSVDANGALAYVDAADLTAAPGPDCATNDNCAPVGLGITDNGTRLIVEENSKDTYLTYAIAADGSLSYLNSATNGILSSHGVGINAAGTYVYHGSQAFSRAADVITDLANGGQDGNASTVLNIGGTERLYTTLGTSRVAVLSLADPANPTVIDEINPDAGGGNSSVFMSVTPNGARILAVGDSSVAIVDFDGTALTVRDQATPAGRARGAAINADGTLAVVTFQTGGAKLYSVAADGTLTEIADVASPNPTRAVVFATLP